MQENEEQPKNKSAVPATMPTLPMIQKDFRRTKQHLAETPEQPESQQKKGDTTNQIAIQTNLVFSEEEPDIDEDSIKADPSVEFRRTLNRSGTRYRIEKLLALGGFGKVFLAEDRILGRKAVVKSLKEELLENPNAVEQFIAEAKLSSQLDHPAIVPLFSLDSDSKDGLHLSMKYIRGTNLKEYIARCRTLQLENHYDQLHYNKMLRERLEMFLHICDAIEYSHHKKIVHNDLKPENIMVAQFGQLYIMDWGIASFVDTKNKDGLSGTPSYMAPEAFCTGIRTELTDVFALGMILNELATLRGPISGKDSEEIAEKICTGQFEPSTCIDPCCKVSPALRAIIETARHPNPKSRYQKVHDLAMDIRHLLFNEEVKAYPDTPFQALMRIMYRHRRVTLGVITTVIVLALSLFLWTYIRANQMEKKISEERLRSVVRENEIVQKVNDEMLRNFKIQARVEQLAMELGRRLVIQHAQLRTISDSIAVELAMPQQNETAKNVPFYMNEDFKPGSPKCPPGLVHNKALYQDPFTLEFSTYYSFSKDLKKEDIQRWANRLSSLHSQRSSTLFTNMFQKYADGQTNSSKLFYLKGSLVRRIMILLDNGLVVAYPGMYHPATSQQDFQSEYIRREQRALQNVVWSPPFLDFSGHACISCWRGIFAPDGRPIGSIGFNLSYEEVVRPIFEQAKKEMGKTNYVLIDPDEHLIFSSSKDNMHFNRDAADDELLTMTGLNSFRFPYVIRKIRQKNAPPQFTARLAGKDYRISWAKVPFANWLLVQRVALEDTGFIDSVNEITQRQSLRDELLHSK